MDSDSDAAVNVAIAANDDVRPRNWRGYCSDCCAAAGRCSTGVGSFCYRLFCCTSGSIDTSGYIPDTQDVVIVHATLDSCCGEMEFVDVPLVTTDVTERRTLFHVKKDVLTNLMGSTAAITETRLFYTSVNPKESWWPCKFRNRLHDDNVGGIAGKFILVSVIGREVSKFSQSFPRYNLSTVFMRACTFAALLLLLENVLLSLDVLNPLHVVP